MTAQDIRKYFYAMRVDELAGDVAQLMDDGASQSTIDAFIDSSMQRIAWDAKDAVAAWRSLQ